MSPANSVMNSKKQEQKGKYDVKEEETRIFSPPRPQPLAHRLAVAGRAVPDKSPTVFRPASPHSPFPLAWDLTPLSLKLETENTRKNTEKKQ
jgi:hypothetical protein